MRFFALWLVLSVEPTFAATGGTGTFPTSTGGTGVAAPGGTGSTGILTTGNTGGTGASTTPTGTATGTSTTGDTGDTGGTGAPSTTLDTGTPPPPSAASLAGEVGGCRCNTAGSPSGAWVLVPILWMFRRSE